MCSTLSNDFIQKHFFSLFPFVCLQKIEEEFACAREIRRRGERERRERVIIYDRQILICCRENIYTQYYVGSFFDDDAGRRMCVERNQRANDERDE